MIRPISHSEILDAKGLLAEYAAECSIPEIGETNPQREMYAHMESTGFMRCFGAFEGDDLVGFASILIYVLPHYGKTVASVESLFVQKSHRHGGSGVKLMQTIEKEAKEKGCTVVLYSAPTDSKLDSVLTERRGYRRTNAVYTRKLQ